MQILKSGEHIETIEPMRGDPMRSIARAAIAHARATLSRSGVRPEEIAKGEWQFDPAVQLILRAAATPPTSMANAPALVQIILAVLPALAPQSAAAELFDNSLKLQYVGGATFAVPGIVPANAKFVGEGLPKPVVQGLTNLGAMTPAKIAAIVVASAELIAQAAPEAMINAMLAEAAGPALDVAVFGNAAGSATSPAGLLNGISASTPAPSTSAVYDAVLADLGTLAGAVAGVAGNGKIAYVMNPAQAATARLAVQANPNYLILASSGLAAGTVIAVATNAIASVLGVPGFETSTQALLQMDDAPSGGVMTGGSTSSMFQTNNVGIKMIMPVTWARRAAGGVAYMTSVAW
jgi:hypothetical protein